MRGSSVRTELGSGKRAVAADTWPAIAFRLKTLGLARGTDRANSGAPPREHVCYRTAKYQLLLTNHYDFGKISSHRRPTNGEVNLPLNAKKRIGIVALLRCRS